MQTWKLYNVEAMDFNLFFRVDNTTALHNSMPETAASDFKMLWQVISTLMLVSEKPCASWRPCLHIMCLCAGPC